MNQKALTRKTRQSLVLASRRSLQLTVVTKDPLTRDVALSLPSLRKATQKAQQYSIRLRRRLAKATGAAKVPKLERGLFKRAADFEKLKRLAGLDVAVAGLMATKF